ncbi:MAG: hypothetical protein ABSH35_29915 [Isosphaeraceae bacterium]|jgi:hypothetical protein
MGDQNQRVFRAKIAGRELLMAMNKPKHAGIGLAVVVLGLPVYHLVFTRLAPREAPGDASGLAGSSPASPAVETT